LTSTSTGWNQRTILVRPAIVVARTEQESAGISTVCPTLAAGRPTGPAEPDQRAR